MSYDEQIMPFLKSEAARAARRRGGLVDADDLFQDMALYAYGDGRALFEKALAHPEGGALRIRLGLRGVVNAHAREKAKNDVASPNLGRTVRAWYAPGKTLRRAVAIALAMDGCPRGPRPAHRRRRTGSETGSLSHVIWDTQDALDALPEAKRVLASAAPGSDEFVAAERQLAAWLGGEFEGADVVYRKTVMSNRTAISLLAVDYEQDRFDGRRG